MTEMIPGTNIPMTHNKLKLFDINPKKLLLFRKYFLILTSLMLVMFIVQLYTQHSFTVSALSTAILAVMLFTFSTKCETLYLKMKIEEVLDNQGAMN